MAYTKQTWVDDVSDISAERLNHMEAGIFAAVPKEDIEYGTFTPQWFNGNGSMLSATIASNRGVYYRIGKFCYIVITLSCSVTANGAGGAKMGGLPVNPKVGYEQPIGLARGYGGVFVDATVGMRLAPSGELFFTNSGFTTPTNYKVGTGQVIQIAAGFLIE